MTIQNGRKHLSAAELSAVLSYVRTRADLARQKGTTRAFTAGSVELAERQG
ncbi:MAG TPA: hypothetical protein VMW24_06360 [Sedimentisphaerales bacterium]|nr:hypothetical protein [Sedimentisphaerales bacterium]